MVTTNSAYKRYLIIDECITNPRIQATKKNMLQKIEEEIGKISQRQLETDLVNIGLAPINAPVMHYREGRAHLYKYIDEEKTLHKFRIPEAALMELTDAYEILEQMKGAPFLKPIKTYIERHLKQHNKALPKRHSPAILFEENPNLKGLNYFLDLYDAIIKQQVLRIEYQEFGKEEKQEYIIHPYVLKSFNQRWFLFGKNHEYPNPNKKWNVPLDRIEGIQIENQLNYIPCQLFDWQKHFGEILGVTYLEEQSKVKIQLSLDENRLPYVRTKPIHPSQEIFKDENGRSLVEIHVRPNRELFQKLLSFGGDLEVVSPPEIRRQMQEHLDRAINKYQEVVL